MARRKGGAGYVNGRRFSALALRRRQIVAAVEDWVGALLGMGMIFGGQAHQ